MYLFILFSDSWFEIQCNVTLRKLKLTYIIYDEPFRTSQRTQYISITSTHRLILQRKRMVYILRIKKYLHSLCEQNIEFPLLNRAVHILSTVLWRVNLSTLLLSRHVKNRDRQILENVSSLPHFSPTKLSEFFKW